MFPGWFSGGFFLFFLIQGNVKPARKKLRPVNPRVSTFTGEVGGAVTSKPTAHQHPRNHELWEVRAASCHAY